MDKAIAEEKNVRIQGEEQTELVWFWTEFCVTFKTKHFFF